MVASARSPTESKAGQMPLAGHYYGKCSPAGPPSHLEREAGGSPMPSQQLHIPQPFPSPTNTTLTQAGNPGHCLQVFSLRKE